MPFYLRTGKRMGETMYGTSKGIYQIDPDPGLLILTAHPETVAGCTACRGLGAAEQRLE